MRKGFETNITRLRRKVFVEVARVAFESEMIKSDIEAIPYKITPTEKPQYRESVYRERAIASERVRLAMGMSLNPQDRPAHITNGLSYSKFMHGLKLANVDMNRKMLAEMAVNDAAGFATLAETAKSKLA